MQLLMLSSTTSASLILWHPPLAIKVARDVDLCDADDIFETLAISATTGVFYVSCSADYTENFGIKAIRGTEISTVWSGLVGSARTHIIGSSFSTELGPALFAASSQLTTCHQQISCWDLQLLHLSDDGMHATSVTDLTWVNYRWNCSVSEVVVLDNQDMVMMCQTDRGARLVSVSAIHNTTRLIADLNCSHAGPMSLAALEYVIFDCDPCALVAVSAVSGHVITLYHDRQPGVYASDVHYDVRCAASLCRIYLVRNTTTFDTVHVDFSSGEVNISSRFVPIDLIVPLAGQLVASASETILCFFCTDKFGIQYWWCAVDAWDEITNLDLQGEFAVVNSRSKSHFLFGIFSIFSVSAPTLTVPDFRPRMAGRCEKFCWTVEAVLRYMHNVVILVTLIGGIMLFCS